MEAPSSIFLLWSAALFSQSHWSSHPGVLQFPSSPLHKQRHGLHNSGWQVYAMQTNDSRGGTSVRQTQGLIVLNQGPCILRVAKRWKLRAPFCLEGAATVQPTNPEMRRYKWKRQVPCYRSTFLPFCLSTLLSFHLSISLHSFSRPAITQPHIEHQHEFYWFHTGFSRFMLQNSGPLFVDGNGNGTSHPPSETDMYMEASSSIILCCSAALFSQSPGPSHLHLAPCKLANFQGQKV